MIKKLLIANRGEIACRIIKTARKMGIETLAVFSAADRHALHTQQADQAFYVGPAPASDSYLAIESIIDIAKQTRADAIHPGYGFLAENADFAQACEVAGLIFIGPTAETIKTMGAKSRAKTLMQASGVPVLPGYHGQDNTLATLQTQAKIIGYPVLIKASAGGGGKGMRIVDTPEQLEEAVKASKREAEKSFADGSLLLEKYLPDPRHIEIQVCLDTHGNGVHLFSRDCSIQRRYQKIIEEAPAPGISDTMETAMGELAVKAAQQVAYRGVGTFEFLVDQDHKFYFMEMNTRLQVEHPVSEMITGIDLVEWQIRIASGEPLPLTQQDIGKRGHAIEARIYAEDPDTQIPDQRFMPSTGLINTLSLPAENQHTRLDNGIKAGDIISPHYDPMLAKLISWEADRDSAIDNLNQALDQFKITGLKTNRNFLLRILQSEYFARQPVTTHFLHHHAFAAHQISDAEIQQALMLATFFSVCISHKNPDTEANLWQTKTGWRLNHPAEHQVRLKLKDASAATSVTNLTASVTAPSQPMASGPEPLNTETTILELDISSAGAGQKSTRISGYLSGYLDACLNKNNKHSATLHVTIDNKKLIIACHYKEQLLSLFFQNYSLDIELNPASSQLSSSTKHHNQDRAPMNGRITTVHLSASPGNAGHPVKEGQAIISMEAMKMEYTLRAPGNGLIKTILVAEGDLVEEGTLLFQFKPQQQK